jgi:hypothetical protein
MDKSFKFICLVLICIGLISCSTSIGTTHLYGVNKDKTLGAPWEPIHITENRKDVIYRSTAETKKEGSDIFSIFVTDAYFRYLPDLGGINEVIIIAEFTEADTDKGENLVKVLGPYKNIADMTKGSFFNKPIYGPKRLESNLLSMNIKIYEYDQEEKENNAAMLDFIADLGTGLSVANPVTIAEIALAKKVAGAINDTNKNDLIMQADITFVGGDKNLHWSANKHTNGLLLKAGELVLIKQEACQVGNCFNYFSSANQENPVAWLADVVLAVPVALKRGLTDAPDRESLEDMLEKKGELAVGEYGVVDSNPGFLDSKGQLALYTDKTWLRLNIVKGGDASKWEARKALWILDEEIQEKVKNADTDLVSLGQALANVKKKADSLKSTVSINRPNNYEGQYYFYSDKNNVGFCLELPHASKLASKPIVTSDNHTVKLDKTVMSASDRACYFLSTGNKRLIQGTYQLGVTYTLSDVLKTEWFPLLSIPQPTITQFECIAKATSSASAELKITGTNLNNVVGLDVDGEYIDVESSISTTELKLVKGKIISKLYTPAGEVVLPDPKAVTSCP